MLTAGLGEMGGAQPLAITMNGGVGLVVEVDEWRAQRRLDHRYIDEVAENLDEALEKVRYYVEAGEPRSIGLIDNAANSISGTAGAGTAAGYRHRSDIGA